MSTVETKPAPQKTRLEYVGLPEIIIDLEIQQRSGWTKDDATVKEYAERMKEGDKFPAAVVFEDETGATYLADGFTRYYASELAGKTKLGCEVKTGTRSDAIWYACSANKAHGVRRSNADKRKAVLTAVQHPYSSDKSDREIAVHCGVSNTLVSEVRASLVEEGAIEERTEATTASGKKIKTDKATKAKKSAAGKKGGAAKAAVTPPSKKKSPPTKGDVSAADTEQVVHSPTAEIKDGKVLDADGTQVTGDLAKVFARVSTFQQMAEGLRIISRKYEALVKEPAGCFLGLYDASVLGELATAIDAATPFRVNESYSNGWEPKDISKVDRNKDFKDAVEVTDEEATADDEESEL